MLNDLLLLTNILNSQQESIKERDEMKIEKLFPFKLILKMPKRICE